MTPHQREQPFNRITSQFNALHQNRNPKQSMKHKTSSTFAAFVHFIAFFAIVALFTGCASGPEKPPHQRGWIGGQFKHVALCHPGITNLPPSEPSATNDGPGLLITALSTNTPAYLAGLREGDVIANLDGHPPSKVDAFRKNIDQHEPGSTISITAWREGQKQDYNVTVGCEKFRHGGYFAIGIFINGPDLWPNPGFSLLVLGYQDQPQSRTEMNSVENLYRRKRDPKWQGYDQDWNAWLCIFSVGKGKHIVSQSIVPAATGPAQAAK
jgi:hypothetical protein